MTQADQNHAKQGLLLDFGGVLTTNFFAPFEAFCEARGLPPATIKMLMTEDPAGRALWHQVELGQIDQPEFEARLAAMIGLPSDGLIRGLLADLRPEPLMLNAVTTARQAGVRIGIISNSWGCEPYDPYVDWDLPSLADIVLISHELGLRKPDPAIFLLACERIGVPPASCVFVDDIAANLPAARNLGVAVVHHVDPELTVRELERLLGLTLTV